jgi:uncharacterized protein
MKNMLRITASVMMSLIAFSGCGQKVKNNGLDKVATNNKTLLWKVSGNGLEKPSYLFGTMHLLCKEDAFVGDNLVKAIKECDKVYFELDMDNLVDMLGAMTKIKMKGDTTLRDLLSEEDYQKVKAYFKEHSTMLPFSMLETYKPFVAASMLMEGAINCDEQVSMEQLIMDKAKEHKKGIEGLETTAYQMSLFDSIPYKVQAQELIKTISGAGTGQDAEKVLNDMMKAYREQDLQQLAKMINETEGGVMEYEDLLLNNRNRNWVEKLKKLMPEKPVVVAVGAGHLPGDKGVINLLKKAGYTVTPVENKNSAAVREI